MSNQLSVPFGGRPYEYAVVDVFSERALQGNMLAVFSDGRGLSDAEMQALARETNLAETTFIIPRDVATERERGVRVRIFTVKEELEFAGHPTLGTASWLWWNHAEFAGGEEFALELRIGKIPVRFTRPAAGEAGVFAEMRQRDPEFGSVHSKTAVAAALDLREEDLSPDLPVQTVSTGMAFCIVPLASMEVAKRLQSSWAKVGPYLATTDAKFFYCITPAEKNSGADWHARMQFYNGEDPATGSACGCAISYLVRHDAVKSEQKIFIEQGIEVLRPSRLRAHAKLLDSKVTDVHVGGRTIPVASGRFFLP